MLTALRLGARRGVCLNAAARCARPLGAHHAVRCKASSVDPETAFTGTSLNAIDMMYTQWLEDPSSVNETWAQCFRNIEHGTAESGEALLWPGTIEHNHSTYSIDETLRVLSLTRAFRTRGHLVAKLDPLNMDAAYPEDDDLAPYLYLHELDYKSYGFTEKDLDREFYLGSDFIDRKTLTLREILHVMTRTYCGSVGVEYRHLLSKEQKDWIQQRVESPEWLAPLPDHQRDILHDLSRADLFERFLAKKHPGTKRFGLEGGETSIVGLNSFLLEGAKLGIQSFVVGMAHRGRLNVLGNIIGKSLTQIFSEFDTTKGVDDSQLEGSGDVKYHLGTNETRRLSDGSQIYLSLTANPSHLEAVNPVVIGKVRAKQHRYDDKHRTQNAGILIHGDAAFAGQGIVAETLAMADLHNYTIGGCLHIIINNQIGFTTDPRQSRSTPYPSDIAKCIGGPIFHVNGDDPEAVYQVCKTAVEFRQHYKRDVVVDVFCYRRHGHNEGDEPTFTQPKMYGEIKKQARSLKIYQDRLINAGVVSRAECEKIEEGILDEFEGHYKEATSEGYTMKKKEWLEYQWTDIKSPKNTTAAIFPTRVTENELLLVGNKLCETPENFNLHSGIKRLLKRKQEMMDTKDGIDWGTAEALAFGTLLREGYHVRMSGQDVQRGTFTHRHAILTDQKSEDWYTPLRNLPPSGTRSRIRNDKPMGTFSICNSNLSEFACLGFELGYSLEHPHCLVLWEAQFGDFVNGAQIMIDQFISSGEQKWLRQSGLTMLLPHGYEGQGPEHSSARLERFLQMCDDPEDVFPTPEQTARAEHTINMQVVNITTAANYFHCLRRQMHREWRKPLVVMSPKSMLRAKQAQSPVSAFTDIDFQRLIADDAPEVDASKVRKVLLSTGKVFYDLEARRAETKAWDVALLRVEQIAPFPMDRVREEVSKYTNYSEVMWVQEEPRNMGAWTYVRPRIETSLPDGPRIQYAGRAQSASPATGSAKIHQKELSAFLDVAFS